MCRQRRQRTDGVGIAQLSIPKTLLPLGSELEPGISLLRACVLVLAT